MTHYYVRQEQNKSCKQTKFLKNRTNILLRQILPDFCHGFFWSEENVDLNYFPTLDGVCVLVALEFYLGRC